MVKVYRIRYRSDGYKQHSNWRIIMRIPEVCVAGKRAAGHSGKRRPTALAIHLLEFVFKFTRVPSPKIFL